MSAFLHVSPSVLDKYQAWMDAENSWEDYYGDQETPSVSITDWEKKLEDELIDACNGVETPSSRAADLGTCLNEAVDCVLLNMPCQREDIKIWQTDVDGNRSLVIEKTPNTFMFHPDDVEALATHVKGCTPQKMVSAYLSTNYGVVQLYGYPDYFDNTRVIDLKTTSRYDYGKFRYKWQRYVYPYILDRNGLIPDYERFDFLVCKVTGDTKRNPFVELQLYYETYTDPLPPFEEKIRTFVESFCSWFTRKHEAGIVNEKLLGNRLIQ